MKTRRMTPEMERMFDNEAYRRARGDPIAERTPTKILSRKTGLAYGYIANVIAKMRRVHERKIHITIKTSTQQPAKQ